MVRRWSRLIYNTINYKSYKFLLFKYRFKSFRKAIIFRKFFTSYSKINRKHYSRLKHSYNWLPYSQIWQHWVKDFLLIKNLFKFQFLKSFNLTEYLSYDPYRFNTKQLKLQSFNEHLSCGITKQIFLNKNHALRFFLHNSIFFKNSFLHFSYFLPTLFSFSFTPLYNILENEIISLDTYKSLNINTFNVNNFSIFIFETSLQLLKEIYRICILLFITTTFNKVK